MCVPRIKLKSNNALEWGQCQGHDFYVLFVHPTHTTDFDIDSLRNALHRNLHDKCKRKSRTIYDRSSAYVKQNFDIGNGNGFQYIINWTCFSFHMLVFVIRRRFIVSTIFGTEKNYKTMISLTECYKVIDYSMSTYELVYCFNLMLIIKIYTAEMSFKTTLTRLINNQKENAN